MLVKYRGSTQGKDDTKHKIFFMLALFSYYTFPSTTVCELGYTSKPLSLLLGNLCCFIEGNISHDCELFPLRVPVPWKER